MNTLDEDVASNKIVERFQHLATATSPECPPVVQGILTRVVGMTLEAAGLNASMGQRCLIEISARDHVQAEVVGFAGERTFLMPVQRIGGLRSGLRVRPVAYGDDVPIGESLLGRVLGGDGSPLDGRGPLVGTERASLHAPPINPLQRRAIRQPLDVGVRSINSLLTIGRGQRMGIFAGSGIGKSMLLGMMTRFTTADVTVVALVGERGREAREFVEDVLGPEGMRRAVVVVSPADDAPLMRLRCARMATRIAEDFRDRGADVLLLMDSLTRFAQAQREIGLSIGEPPATRGYTPSVFARIPELVERAGNGRDGTGSITAFYTVLVEGDDLQDPVADASRAILDGHLVLSRKLADQGLYPAVDVEASISRAMTSIVSEEHLALVQRFRTLNAAYEANRDLISVGAYAAGSDPNTDEALRLLPAMRDFLSQGLNEQVLFEQGAAQLREMFAGSEFQTASLAQKMPADVQRLGAS